MVLAKYKHSEDLIEEYIDLDPILENLYIDKKRFLEPVREVVAKNDRHKKSS